MSSIPTTIRSLCSWERSFPRRHTTFNVTFIAIRNHFQQQLMPNSFHIIFVFITPLMLNLIALRYQGKSITPFDTQPITMMEHGVVWFTFIGILCIGFIPRVSPTESTDSIRTLCIAVDGLAILCTGAEERETKIK
ncbi:hypothetical protein FCV25MIE_14898 [Fagus crenata]